MSYRLRLLLLCLGYRGVGSEEFASPPIGSHFNAEVFLCSSFRSLKRFTEPEVMTSKPPYINLGAPSSSSAPHPDTHQGEYGLR